MKYKVGDKIRIKDLGWYDENKDEYGYIECGKSSMNFEKSQLCGKIVTISRINDATNTYRIEEDNGFYDWTDEMIECKVEDECPQDFIEKYCKSCGTQRCDRTEEYLNGCPYYNAYMCKKQNNAMEEETKQEYDYVTAMNDLMGLEIEKSCILNDFDEYKKAVEKHGYFSEEALTRKLFINLRKNGIAQNVLENFGFNLPDGYIFKDENGNIINTTKIVLEKKTVEEKYNDVKIQIFGNVVILKGGINADNPTEYMNEVVDYILNLLGKPKYNQFIEDYLDNPWVRILIFDFNSMKFNNSFDDIVTNFKQ